MSKTNKAFADDLREMMSAWNTIEKAAREQNPRATERKIYEIASSAMDRSLGIE